MVVGAGRARGVALFGKTHFTGIVAWWLWLAVHIFFLIGFRNRFVVMFEWSWAYWTRQRSNRVFLQRAMPPTSTGDPGEIHEPDQ